MKPTTTWILIADGARARLFQNEGPGRGITELPAYARDNDLKPSREINADKPGRSFDSGGEGRHAMEPPTDPKRHGKQNFANELAAMLKKARDAGKYDRVVLVAPPTTLGDIRNALDKTIATLVHGELAKDLTQVPVHDLPDHLGAVLAI